MQEHPGEIACCRIRRVDPLVQQEQVGEPTEELSFSLWRQRAIGNVGIKHRHGHFLQVPASSTSE
jgi:hypothetical protein